MIERWSILAGMRFILASVVAVNHMDGYATPSLLAWMPMFGAFEAILGFLLISGYSIGSSYQKQPQGFLMRRVQRLYPIYLTALAFAVAVGWWLDRAHLPSVPVLLANALFLNQLVTTDSFIGPAWSLALEFWLYCLAPWLMALSVERVRLLAWGSFIAFAGYTAGRTLFGWPYYSGLGYGGNLVLLAFAWVAGLLLSRAKTGETWHLRDIALMFAGHAGLTMLIQAAYRLKHHELGLFFTTDLIGLMMRAATLLAVWLVFQKWVIGAKQGTEKSWLLRWLGDVSYPLYLLHVPLAMLLAAKGYHNELLYYVSAVVLSALIYRLIDTYSRKRHLREVATQ